MQTLRSQTAGRLVVASLVFFGLSMAPAPVATQQPEAASPATASVLVYFGTYTGERSQGIYTSRLDPRTGALSAPTLAAETPNPSFLAVHPARDFLYAVNEVGKHDGKATGTVSAFAIDRSTGALKPLNSQPSLGANPAHLVVDQTGRNVLVANYSGGNVAVLPIGPDGTLRPASAVLRHEGSSADPARQKEPHPHAVEIDPENRFVYVPDLGIDKVMIYRFDPDGGRLVPNDPPFAAVEAGAGPRHFAFHTQGRFAYLINELSCTITAFSRDPGPGTLGAVQNVSTLPAGQSVQKGYSTAEIQVHPSGRFLYGSNRGHDTIAVFTIDQQTGHLTLVEHEPTQGSTPRSFGIDPSGAYLLAANQRSDSVVVFRIDQTTGRLTPAGHTIKVGSPVSVQFVRNR